MISAGYFQNQPNYGYNQGGYNYNQQRQTPQQSFKIGGYQQVKSIGMGNNLPWKLNLKGDNAEQAMNWQGGLQAGQGVVNAIIAGFNWDLASDALKYQADVAGKYYESVNTIADCQLKLGLRQEATKMSAIDAQERMQNNQINHEQRMMKLEGATQARLALIAENGKTARAKVFMMKAAFMRDNRSLGNPVA